MKRLIIIAFLFGLQPLFAQDSTYAAGNTAYANGDYKDALIAYNKLVAEDYRSSDLYYNLGNTYYRLNEIGEAIWAYERALKIDPSHENAIYNLKLVKDKSASEVNLESKGISNWIDANLFGFSINFWAYFGIIISGFFAISIYFFFTTKRQKIKNTSLSASLIFLSLLIIGFVLAYMQSDRLTSKYAGIIVTNPTAVLAEPAEKGEYKFDLTEGAKVQILRTNEKWIEIDFKGHSGWISREAVWEI